MKMRHCFLSILLSIVVNVHATDADDAPLKNSEILENKNRQSFSLAGFGLPGCVTDIPQHVTTSMHEVYERIRNTDLFSRREFNNFAHLRAHFEEIAFQLMKKHKWTLAGYNPDPNRIGVVGKTQPEKKVRVTLINGMLNTHEVASEKADMISQLHGNSMVHYLYSASSGFTADILRALFVKIGLHTPQSKLLATTWKQLIAEMGGAGQGGTIVHYAHSIGGADTYCALQQMSEEERQMIQVKTFGSAALIPHDNAQYVQNYISRHDAIPIFDMVNYVQGLRGLRSDITFLDAKKSAPYFDHAFNGDTYRATLEELGKEFQKKYYSKSLVAKSLPLAQTSIPKTDSQAIIEKIRRAILRKDYTLLNKIFTHDVHSRSMILSIGEVAKEEDSVPLQRAVCATKAILDLDGPLGLKQGEILSIALFIETSLPKLIAKDKYYFRYSEVDIPRTVEYDPRTKNIFIHLGTNNLKKIGHGYHKVVTRSILYSLTSPEVVANCSVGREAKKEMEIMQSLQGIKGIIEGRAFIMHDRRQTGDNGIELILKLYNAGSLRTIHYDKTERFTLLEKMKIALQLLRGLEGMHAKKIVHCDLHTGNFLINITPKGKNGYKGAERKVEAAIIDFGRAIHINSYRDHPPQAYRWYLAPEAFAYEKLHSEDYFKTDIYALGCALYGLFYQRDPAWFQDKYFQNRDYKDRKHLKEVILQATEKKRAQLLARRTSGKPLTPKERFEVVVLRMVSPNPLQRKSAAILRQEMSAIVKKYLLEKKHKLK